MIGKSLSERYGQRRMLAAAESVAIMTEHLDAQAKYIVQVRAADLHMIACLIVRADEAAVKWCRSFGFEMKVGGVGVLGLLGSDAARAFPELPAEHRAWLESPCSPRETKVLVVGAGLGLVSIETIDGSARVTAFAGT